MSTNPFTFDKGYVEKLAGTYRILNTQTEKCYIGSSVDIFDRWREHWQRLRDGGHHSRKLQNSWGKHGPDIWIFGVLEILKPVKELLLSREQFWIDSFDSYRQGYNICPLASSCLGVKRGPKTKAALAEASRRNTGRRLSEGTKAKLRANWKRRKDLGFRPNWSQEARESTKQRMLGNKLGTLASAHPPISEVTRKKLINSHLGKRGTEEQYEKQSSSLVKRWQDPKFKARMIAARIGKKRGPYKLRSH